MPLIRLQCYEGIDASQALYDWDFPRQILHLRALEAGGGRGRDVEEAEKRLFSDRFLLARPVLRALQQSPAVLLVDEIDRADDEFEAFLLEVLSTFQVTHPRARHGARRPCRRWSCSPPTAPASCTTPSSGAASTTGSTTPVWSARWRSSAPAPPRCPRRLAEQVVALVQQLRDRATCSSRRASPRPSTGPGRCTGSAPRELDVEAASRTLGAAVKYREDSRPGPGRRWTGCWRDAA